MSDEVSGAGPGGAGGGWIVGPDDVVGAFGSGGEADESSPVPHPTARHSKATAIPRMSDAFIAAPSEIPTLQFRERA